MKIVIIGAGLGGLECGYLLAKRGFEVTILEQNTQIGGSLQSFTRKGIRFDTGFHYVGGLGEGQLLHTLFQELNLLHLPWRQLDTECFDEVIWNDKHYQFANGYEAFADTLSASFPDKREALRSYAAFLKSVQTSLADLSSNGEKTMELLSCPAHRYLTDTLGESTVRDIVSATSLKMELQAETLPLYIYSQINGSFIESAWRLRGGGQQIADSLAHDIHSFGGQVLCKKRVVGFVEESGSIRRVCCADGETYPCDFVISDIHPAALMKILPEGSVRSRYKQRILTLPNSFGVFTVSLALERGCVPYLNRNLFIHDRANLWEAESRESRISSVGVHFSVPEEGGSTTDNIDLFFPMRWGEVARWEETRVGHRGSDYEAFKSAKAEEAIRLVEPHIPNLRGHISSIYTSSPLTYRDYTGTMEGSAYGIRKDCNHLLTTMIPVRTPIANLFLTGQNVNFHGVLGVSITARLTTQQILAALQ